MVPIEVGEQFSIGMEVYAGHQCSLYCYMYANKNPNTQIIQIFDLSVDHPCINDLRYKIFFLEITFSPINVGNRGEASRTDINEVYAQNTARGRGTAVRPLLS